MILELLAACVMPVHPVTIPVSPERWPNVADHIADVRHLYPRRLTIDRDGADERRQEALRNFPTAQGFDRDEYPPAVAFQGGDGRPGPGRRASVRLVPSSENRSAGAYMGGKLRRLCDGAPFRLVAR